MILVQVGFPFSTKSHARFHLALANSSLKMVIPALQQTSPLPGFLSLPQNEGNTIEAHTSVRLRNATPWPPGRIRSTPTSLAPSAMIEVAILEKQVEEMRQLLASERAQEARPLLTTRNINGQHVTS
jgi:hypothetical protein